MSEFTPTQKKVLGAAGGAVALAGIAAGVITANHDGAPRETTVAVGEAPADLDTSHPGDPVIVAPEITTTTEAPAPVATEAPAQTPPKTVLAPSGENELTPQTAEQVMAQLGHPEVGQNFQENILLTVLSLTEDNVIYSGPDANAPHLTSQAGAVTNAALLNERYGCFTMTSDNPEQPDLIVGCIDLVEAGIDLDTIQKGSMTVEQLGQDGRGLGQVNGELQPIAAFDSTANDVVIPQ